MICASEVTPRRPNSLAVEGWCSSQLSASHHQAVGCGRVAFTEHHLLSTFLRLWYRRLPHDSASAAVSNIVPLRALE